MIKPQASSTFRYWHFFIQECLFLSSSFPAAVIMIMLVIKLKQDLTVTEITMLSIFITTVACTCTNLVLTYFYSTDMFIAVAVPCMRLHRLYPYQVDP